MQDSRTLPVLATVALLATLAAAEPSHAQSSRKVQELKALESALYHPVHAGLREISFRFRHCAFENAALPFRAARFQFHFEAPDQWSLDVIGLHESHRHMAPRLTQLMDWVRLVAGGMMILDVGLDPKNVDEIARDAEVVRLRTHLAPDAEPWTLEFEKKRGRYYLRQAESRATGHLRLRYDNVIGIDVVTAIEIDDSRSALGPWTLRCEAMQVNPTPAETQAPGETAPEASSPPISIPPDFGRDDPFWRRAMDSFRERFDFSEAKLDSVVAEIDGRPILYRDVLDEAVLRYGQKFVEQYANDLILLVEMEADGVEVSEQEMRVGLDEVWQQLQARKVTDSESLWKELHWTPEYLELKVYLTQGGETLFARDRGEDLSANPDPFLLQLWMNDLLGRYPRCGRLAASDRGDESAALMQIGERAITAAEIAPLLLPNLERTHFDLALDGLIERRLVEAELERLGVHVKETELGARIAAERRRYEHTLFTWEAMLQMSSSNVALAKEELRTRLALDEILGRPTEAEIRAHFESSPVWFGHGAVAACEIKTLFSNEVERQGALARILAAKQELEDGVSFEDVVAQYSETPDADRGDMATLFDGMQQRVLGTIGIFPIRDGRMPNEIAAAAFLVSKGEWIGPVESKDGYHLLYVLDAKQPRSVRLDDEPFTDSNANGAFDRGEAFEDLDGDGNWTSGQRRNVIDDYERERLKRWTAVLLRATDVRRYREGW